MRFPAFRFLIQIRKSKSKNYLANFQNKYDYYVTSGIKLKYRTNHEQQNEVLTAFKNSRRNLIPMSKSRAFPRVLIGRTQVGIIILVIFSDKYHRCECTVGLIAEFR